MGRSTAAGPTSPRSALLQPLPAREHLDFRAVVAARRAGGVRPRVPDGLGVALRAALPGGRLRAARQALRGRSPTEARQQLQTDRAVPAVGPPLRFLYLPRLRRLRRPPPHDRPPSC